MNSRSVTTARALGGAGFQVRVEDAATEGAETRAQDEAPVSAASDSMVWVTLNESHSSPTKSEVEILAHRATCSSTDFWKSSNAGTTTSTGRSWLALTMEWSISKSIVLVCFTLSPSSSLPLLSFCGSSSKTKPQRVHVTLDVVLVEPLRSVT